MIDTPATSDTSSQMATSSPSFSAPNLHQVLTIKLTNTNVLLWMTQFKPILLSNDLMSLVDGSEPPPTQFLTSDNGSVVNPTFTAWKKRDQVLLSWINSSLSESVLHIVVGTDTDKEAWDDICHTFGSKDEARVVQLLMDLQNLKKGDKSVIEYLSQCKLIADELVQAGKILSTAEFNAIIFNNLGPDFNPIIVVLSSQSKSVAYRNLRSQLKTFESRILQTVSSVTLPSVNLVQHQNPPSYNQNPSSYNKKQKGYKQKDSKSQEFCQICSKRGHTALTCFRRYTPPSPRPIYPQAHMANAYHPHMFPPVPYHPRPAATPPLMPLPNNYSQPPWFMDSGATHHITSDLRNLQNPEPFRGNEQVQVGDGFPH